VATGRALSGDAVVAAGGPTAARNGARWRRGARRRRGAAVIAAGWRGRRVALLVVNRPVAARVGEILQAVAVVVGLIGARRQHVQVEVCAAGQVHRNTVASDAEHGIRGPHRARGDGDAESGERDRK
jgi:hypothetical protein